MYMNIYIHIIITITFFEKEMPKRKKLHKRNVFVFQFYISCANFKKVGQEIKKYI